MAAHDWFDSFRGFLGVIERNGRDVMMEDVSFDYAMEQ